MVELLLLNIQWIGFCKGPVSYNDVGNASSGLQYYYKKKYKFLFPLSPKPGRSHNLYYYNSIENILTEIGEPCLTALLDRINRKVEEAHHENVYFGEAPRVPACTVLNVDKVSIARVLGRIGGEKAMTTLIGFLDTGSYTENDSEEHRKQTILLAIEAVGRSGHNEYISALLEIRKSYDCKEVREATVKALGKILLKSSNNNAEGLLIKSLEGGAGNETRFWQVIWELKKNKDYKSFIYYALGELRDEKSVPILIDALKDKNWTNRYAAAEALQKIGGLLKPVPFSMNCHSGLIFSMNPILRSCFWKWEYLNKR